MGHFNVASLKLGAYFASQWLHKHCETKIEYLTKGIFFIIHWRPMWGGRSECRRIHFPVFTSTNLGWGDIYGNNFYLYLKNTSKSKFCSSRHPVKQLISFLKTKGKRFEGWEWGKKSYLTFQKCLSLQCEDMCTQVFPSTGE